MAFITTSNSLRIIHKIDLQKTAGLNGDLYKKPIYFFSQFEKNGLLALQELFKDPEHFINEFYKPVEREDKMKFVFEGGTPAYHFSLGCSRLTSDFKNFEIPETIKEKGAEEVKRFRNWFKQNIHLLESPSEFAEKLEANFRIIINPKAINFDNSGATEIENLNLNELENKIDNIIKEAGRFYYKSDKHKAILSRFSKYSFLGGIVDEIKNNDTEYSDIEVKNLLKEFDQKFKKPLKKLLIEYYRVLHNPELKFEGQLLEQLGFNPCSECDDIVTR